MDDVTVAVPSETRTATVAESGPSPRPIAASCAPVSVGATPVASSNCPSPSTSHAYVSGLPSGSLEPPPLSVSELPSAAVYGPPALAVGAWLGGAAVVKFATAL